MRKLVSIVVTLLFVLSVTAPAFADVELSGQVMDTIQSIESSDSSGASNNEKMGFGEGWFNLQARGNVTPVVTAYAEIYGSGNSDFTLNEAKIRVKELFPFGGITFGNAVVPFGKQFETRSVNARTQQNPLIGNHLVDPYAVESGVQLHGDYTDSVEYQFGISNGSKSTTVSEESGTARFGRVGGVVIPGMIELYFSGYSHENQDTGPVRSNLFASSGESYTGLTGNTQISSQADQLTASQLDLLITISDEMEIRAYSGTAETSDTSGATVDEIEYQNVHLNWDFSNRSGIAVRYGQATNENLTGTDDTIERTQVGLNHRYQERVMGKVEWVRQTADGDGPILGANNFNGVVGELSVDF